MYQKLLRQAEPDPGRLAPPSAASSLDVISYETFAGYAVRVLTGRQPDSAELSVRPCASGTQAVLADLAERAVLIGHLMASEEFQAAHSRQAFARLSAEDFIAKVYQDWLGRWPDADGLATYLRMERKLFGRRRVIAAISRSAEARKSGGGRAARIASLRQFRWRWLVARLPLIGPILVGRRLIDIRIRRIELAIQSMVQKFEERQDGDELAQVSVSEEAGHTSSAVLGQSVEEQYFQLALLRFRRAKAAGGLQEP